MVTSTWNPSRYVWSPPSWNHCLQTLKERLGQHGYFEEKHIPGLWKHITRPVQFTLVVDDFGVKFVGKEHAQHLLDTLQSYYTVDVDWDGSRYCGISLNWDYDERTLDIAIPGYVNAKLKEYEQPPPSKPRHTPFPAPSQTRSQKPLPVDDSLLLTAKRKKRIQQIIGSFLFYARACDITMLKALNTLGTQQAAPHRVHR